MEMDLQGPNEEGTGRFRFQDIDKIQFALIRRGCLKFDQKKQRQKEIPSKCLSKRQQLAQKKSKKHMETYLSSLEFEQKLQFGLSMIQNLLSAFFQLPVSHSQQINLIINQKNNKIVDQDKMIQYDITQFKRRYDIQSLLDFGMEIKSQIQKDLQNKVVEKQDDKNIKGLRKNRKIKQQKGQMKKSILIFLIQAQLIEDGIQIDGRAIGDGLAFVSFNMKDFLPENIYSIYSDKQNPCFALPILIHECLHTLGFDHCAAWECLMNSSTNEQLLLCPCCVRKLQTQISHKIGLVNWYSTMLKTLKQVKESLRKEYQHGLLPRLFADLINSEDDLPIPQLQKEHGYKYSGLQRYEIAKPLKNRIASCSMLEKYAWIFNSLK